MSRPGPAEVHLDPPCGGHGGCSLSKSRLLNTRALLSVIIIGDILGEEKGLYYLTHQI